METAASDKLKEFLNRKLDESKLKIKKLKRKRMIYKTLFVTSAGTLIVVSVVLVSIASITLPPVVVPILSMTSGVLSGLSVQFDFQEEKAKLSKENREIK